MAERDRIVRWVLVVGGAVAFLAWDLVGPWPAMVVVITTVVIAAITYRVEPRAIDPDIAPALEEDAVAEPLGGPTTDQ